MPDSNFDLVTVNGVAPSRQCPCEHTPSPYLVITATARDEQGRPGFGGWWITHVPTGLAVPLPIPHRDDVTVVRWIAHQLAESDVDWSASPEEFVPHAKRLMREMTAKLDEEYDGRRAPDHLPADLVRRIHAGNGRFLPMEATDAQ